MTTEITYNALFICTGNLARSIVAEGILNELGKGRFLAWSAGSCPKGKVHPQAIATLERLRLPTTGYCSKSWDEFVAPGAPVFDFIFTVCDNAAGEVCPVWPGKLVSAHWGRGRSGRRRRQRGAAAQGFQGHRVDAHASYRAVPVAPAPTARYHVAVARAARHRQAVR